MVRLSAQILFRCTFFSVFLLYDLFLMLYNLPIETNNNAPQTRSVGTPTDREFIQDLANQCPFVGGSAVYKARSLYALYQPGFYIDDMALCNAAGVYKNGNGLFDDENEFLNNLQGHLSTNSSGREMLQIYPNPTQRIVNIRSEIAFKHASWILHDMAGRVIAKGELLDKAFTQQISLPVLSAGVYRLRVENASSVYMNKLIIE